MILEIIDIENVETTIVETPLIRQKTINLPLLRKEVNLSNLEAIIREEAFWIEDEDIYYWDISNDDLKKQVLYLIATPDAVYVFPEDVESKYSVKIYEKGKLVKKIYEYQR